MDCETNVSFIYHRASRQPQSSLATAVQALMDLYDIWKAFVARFGVHSSDIKTGSFYYFKSLNLFAMHTDNTTDIEIYMNEMNPSSEMDQDF